jgi:hypothetical protein
MKNIHLKSRKHNKTSNNTLAAQIDGLRADIESADSLESAGELLSSFIAQTTDNPVKSWLIEFRGIFSVLSAETGGAQHG